MSIYHYGAEWGEDRTVYTTTNKRILVIGQALPAKVQRVPYDSTMLYDWLAEVGISKDQAQLLLEFEAVYDKFPGYKKKGVHNVPTEEQMEEHWNRSLRAKFISANKIWLMGRCAQDFVLGKMIHEELEDGKHLLCTIHPSTMNKKRYLMDKDGLIGRIKLFTND